MNLFTDALDSRGFFDPRYTCDVDNSSPEIRWDDVPDGTVGFALTFADLDGREGIFSHWVVYQIPANLRHLPAGIPPQDSLPNGIRQGANSFGKLGYAGPCPSGNSPHRYEVRLHALRAVPELPNRATREQLLAAIEPFVITTATIDGRYQRQLERAG